LLQGRALALQRRDLRLNALRREVVEQVVMIVQAIAGRDRRVTLCEFVEIAIDEAVERDGSGARLGSEQQETRHRRTNAGHSDHKSYLKLGGGPPVANQSFDRLGGFVGLDRRTKVLNAIAAEQHPAGFCFASDGGDGASEPAPVFRGHHKRFDEFV